MIAFGYVLAMNVFGNVPSVDFDWGNVTVLKDFITAFVASIAFAIIFRVNKRHLLWAGIGSIITFAIYYLLDDKLFLAAIVSAMFTALYSEISARVHKAPTLVFLITGVIPTVPGRYLYTTMRCFVEGDWAGGASYFLDTMSIALGIAAGVVSIAIGWGMVADAVKKYCPNLMAKFKN